MAAPAMRTRRWKRVEYERLVEAGLFHDERLDPLDGQLVVRESQGSRHVTGIRLTVQRLDSTATVAPLAVPSARIAVADLLP